VAGVATALAGMVESVENLGLTAVQVAERLDYYGSVNAATGAGQHYILQNVYTGIVYETDAAGIVTPAILQELVAGSVYTVATNYIAVQSYCTNNTVWLPTQECCVDWAISEPAAPARPENPTAEQLAQWERDRAAHEQRIADRVAAALAADRAERERREAAARELQEAHRKAEELLATHLAPEQREQYRREKKFEVILKARFGLGSSRRYRVEHGWSGNVYLLDKDGRAIERFCIHHRESVPVPDLMLAQKLMLETDEEQFLKTANRTRLAA
jgi:hypothetical protein